LLVVAVKAVVGEEALLGMTTLDYLYHAFLLKRSESDFIARFRETVPEAHRLRLFPRPRALK